MAKLTISEASHVARVARSTLHRAIKKGRLTADPDGRIDTAELLRAGYTLQADTHQERNTTLHDATGELVDLQHAVIEALQRERDLLQHDLDATREREQAALAREQTAQAHVGHLLQMLEEAQQRYDRLLTGPSTAPVPVPGTSRRWRRTILRLPWRRKDPQTE